MRIPSTVRCARAAVAAAALLALLPSCAGAALIRFGSDLKASAAVVEARQTDTAYWQTRFADGRSTRAPANGQLKSFQVKGIALSNPRAGVAGGETMFHLQALRKRPNGTFKILRTSQAFFLPPKGSDPQKITTYRPVNFCVARGDYLAFNTVGGWDGIGGGTGPYPNGTPLQIFARSQGAVVSQFTGANKTTNGATIKANGSRGAGQELLMRLTVGTGSNGTGLCKGGTGR